MLHIADLHAGYGGGTVLHGVDLTVAAGAVHVVVGHNGAGKTTLLHTVMGLHPATAGRLTLDGRDLTGWPTHRRARAGIGLVPQGRRVFATLTVREHLTLTRGRPGMRWPTERIMTLFPALGRRLDHRGGQLSGGEQQMLAIARALRTQPRLLLLDEPTEGLAPALVGPVCDAIGALAADGLGVLVTTPNLPLALALADRVVVLTGGRVAADLDGDTARTDPARFVAAFTLHLPAHDPPSADPSTALAAVPVRAAPPPTDAPAPTPPTGGTP
jgi:branched-chain amino acid transport system ATP-binding protein